MIRRALRLATLTAMTAAAAAVVAGWPDIKRFIRIKQMSARPEVVPVEGRTAYPQSHGAGAPDGTGDFDSALRGGPVRA